MNSSDDQSPILLASCADFSIGNLEVRPSLREISHAGVVTTLEPRVMQVLVLLVDMADRTVSRDLMVARCWNGTFVGDDAIQRCISRLRKLGQSSGAFQIETLTRVGYRLTPHTPQPVITANAASDCLLAVLPFDNLSADPAFDVFADGVSEEILQSIARGSSVRVIGRTSSFQYRGADKQVPRIARELGVTHVLDGSVRRSGRHVRVAAQLVRISDQEMLWTQRFDGDIDNPFDLQDEVARGAMTALDGMIRQPGTAKRLSGLMFDTILSLRQALHSGMTKGADVVTLPALRAAQPDNAEAWGLFANLRAAQRWSATAADEPRLRSEAQIAAEQALAIDPNCGEAHKALFMLEPPAGRFAACEDRLERARLAAPADTEILWSLYFHYLSVGRLGQSFAMAELAWRLDPLRPPNVIAYANALFTAGQTGQSLTLMSAAVERWPHDASVMAVTLWTAAVAGEAGMVRDLLRPGWRERYGRTVLMDNAVFAAEGLISDPAALGRAATARLEARVAAGRNDISLIGICAFLGMDLDALYDLVDRMPVEQLQQPGSLLPLVDGLSHLFLRMNSRLRESPRFVQLCRRLGLVDYWQGGGHWPECVAEVACRYDFMALSTRGAPA
ncbi:winged helix-turn-helix domain-containing protein [Sandarakinorhabdus rubra]|uniref:winged helix-turn-helix domain-containing protein n=1 Tax=Sandarakinorhabdus rubra TaxID=2672568 RepID=UPI0013DD8560|nr:winged helix-turn-helix domain-containing protein [Sandarakinorhabdus rubra]